MLEKIGLYIHTIRYLKPGQIFWRVGKKLGIQCALRGAHPTRNSAVRHGVYLPELDHDPVFLNRFSVEELMRDRVTFLHEGEDFVWEGGWQAAGRSHLWNFNLHYFDFLHPLTYRYLEKGDEALLLKTVQMIRGWIRYNPREKGGDGWSAYTISLRLVNWISYLSAVGDTLDAGFREELENSIYDQYVYLSKHLEKNNLGNHYFENLKTLVLCALFFGDEASLPVFLSALRRECREEILPDGMHFELSPMYHKIILEGMIRVTAALREAGRPDGELERFTQAMLDAAYTLEYGLARTPLFNDSGDNVAKSLDGLLAAAKNHLGLVPAKKEALPHSGYYIFEQGSWKLIVDAGAAGPDYIPGHSHCDAMSFELYRDGVPFLVNCGTYAYQCGERRWFRSTRAHNTVQIAGIDQSEIWGNFRLARRSKTRVTEMLGNGIRMEMTDYKGNRICRELLLTPDSLRVTDRAAGQRLQSHLHSIENIEIICNAEISRSEAYYAPEFGLLQTIHQITATGSGTVELTVPLV